MLVSRSHEEHLLIIRLSHAQYDGYSIAPLLQDLATAYNEHPSEVSTATSFSDYIYYCRQRESKDSIEFWREHLQGSRIAIIPFPSANASDEIISVRESASKSLPPLPEDTTYAILVNASVSLVLSKLVGSDDILFDLVVNTRTLPMQGIDTIVGPCINILPFRVFLQQGQSVDNLCINVREQYANVSQHYHIELADIAGLSNSWSTIKAPLQFGCIVNHVNLDENSEPLSLEGLSCSSFPTATRIDFQNQVLIRSTIHEEEICIEVLTSTGAKTRAWGNKLASSIATAVLSTVEHLSEKFHSSLSSVDIDLDGLSAGLD
ncbi:hypothetical protein ASPSYDRAFT_94154 [Aspergillus sydowii CBS 593.65]|uniref:Condensation domain-containing protein n=1 Tax=Aspergillus sydowii CBS 593.65 TaxID=1036612 RepID=A0A1L9T2F1_9EURO|nr:uncharacterized protein ASPSYDRAFT_94154 [Aspergillus sydowii CBS 593.65]OJJ53644.1 hypothetical protein ASPSYDRAFT_94154 [Aspergillus sydowii CBS 593.65]